jgi:hypothetical protein
VKLRSFFPEHKRPNVYRVAIGHAKASMRRQTEAREILAQLTDASKTRYISRCSFAVIYLALGEKDQALDWLEKDAREGTGFEINFYSS